MNEVKMSNDEKGNGVLPCVSGSSINEINKEKFEKHKKFHIDDDGKHPEAYAVTEIIRESILNRDYKIYYGGGYDKDGDEIKVYDVVVTFNWGGDPFFQMCVDNSDGDACKLVNSNPECTFVQKYL